VKQLRHHAPASPPLATRLEQLDVERTNAVLLFAPKTFEYSGSGAPRHGVREGAWGGCGRVGVGGVAVREVCEGREEVVAMAGVEDVPGLGWAPEVRIG
jgi:hypothetical protein